MRGDRRLGTVTRGMGAVSPPVATVDVDEIARLLREDQEISESVREILAA
jgi:hypothetical protein